MKVGSKVFHQRLGKGVILELVKYGGALVDFSSKEGVLVRVVKIADLEDQNDK